MRKEIIHKPDFKLVGLSVVTNNANEQDPTLAKIGPLVANYFSHQIAQHIKHRIHPGITYSVYTEYESDHHGNYTYFIGEAVSSLEDVPDDLKTISIPTSQYQRFTTEPGPMPLVVIQAWQSIWQMNQETLGGERRYLADFEVYDERAHDPHQAVVDIYIGIR
ncbi:effector binding domain-containing protein [Candidatus Berkiella aquae]|uniref:Bacterial transcription activator, effector binding domain n=1 Tax=Candidatus Berkiella aquae TaxID=295108 RepID=A0A0Q9YXI6_9GAMM|nr:GyrI-like domain-containing protein [Candidatus Berkiella aquae]MCS5711328.1 GyrI-like domain-containing protein [Candidatus Berkiella aquae]